MLAAALSPHKIFRMRMKLILALAALTGLIAAAKADPLAICTVPPVPPVGCTNQDAKCICDANGSCRWFYNCTNPGSQQ